MPRANLGGRRRRSNVDAHVQRRTRNSGGRRERRRPVDRTIRDPILRFIDRTPSADPWRHGDYTHVSDLVYKCMRAVALAGELGIPVVQEEHWTSMRLIHVMGESVHDWIKAQALSKTDKVFGNWSCACGDSIVEHATYAEAQEYECENCGKALDRYQELTLRDDEYMVVGNADIGFKEDGKILVCELKSISKTQFEDLTSPKPDHTLQLHFYRWLLKRNGYEVHPDSSIAYARRDWAPSPPFKEFKLSTQDDERRIRSMLEEAAALKVWREGGPVPDRLLCNSPQTTRAKKCGVCNECFLRPGVSSRVG